MKLQLGSKLSALSVDQTSITSTNVLLLIYNDTCHMLSQQQHNLPW
jgi:hypothetical protein